MSKTQKKKIPKIEKKHKNVIFGSWTLFFFTFMWGVCSTILVIFAFEKYGDFQSFSLPKQLKMGWFNIGNDKSTERPQKNMITQIYEIEKNVSPTFFSFFFWLIYSFRPYISVGTRFMSFGSESSEIQPQGLKVVEKRGACVPGWTVGVDRTVHPPVKPRSTPRSPPLSKNRRSGPINYSSGGFVVSMDNTKPPEE